ncbi:MAG: stage III sporulation protein AA [Lachnospiraceae bacterium]|nr:stage III sporulation protein AA [Lachnospiraceae bacterium]MDD3797417.1 stage III sporulation protein AA [Lachnospiraceae bacterium]
MCCGDSILKIFPSEIKEILIRAKMDQEQLQEIRIRVGQPLVCIYQGNEFFLYRNGTLGKERKQGFVVSRENLIETVSYVSHYSLYAFEEELKQGYITLPGGHRVGIAGKIVMEEHRIRSVKYISFLNIRLSHEIRGCAKQVFPYLIKNGAFCHTLIISPPKCGKTTMLRDIIRMVSDGNSFIVGQNVGVVDERSEIGGSYHGVPQNDLGIRTDVLDCCPKSEGMMMLIRSMSPDIIAVDEIGDYRDVEAIEAVFHCGCKLLATVHGSSMEDVKRKPLLNRMVQSHSFERYVILDHEQQVGHIQNIFDERGTRLYV